MNVVMVVIELVTVIVAGICGFRGDAMGAAQFWACACYIHLQRRDRDAVR